MGSQFQKLPALGEVCERPHHQLRHSFVVLKTAPFALGIYFIGFEQFSGESTRKEEADSDRSQEINLGECEGRDDAAVENVRELRAVRSVCGECDRWK